MLPATGNVVAAIGASAFTKAILNYIVPGAADQYCAALRTKRVRGVRKDVAFVNVLQTGFPRNGTGAVQRFRRRGFLIPQLEIGMERGEMQGDFGSQIF